MSYRVARIDDGLYEELKRIQYDMWRTKGVQISIAEASRILMRRRGRNDEPFRFSLTR